MIKSDSLAKLAPALVKAQKNMGVALKDAKNPFFKSKYADLNAIIDAAIPALNEAGIAVLQSPDVLLSHNPDGTVSGSQAVINTILLHESGEYIAGQSRVIAGKANDAQAEGSATTYARRYGLQAMVTLKAEDDDGNAASGKTVVPVKTAEAGAGNATKPLTKTATTPSAPKVPVVDTPEVKMTQANPENKVTDTPKEVKKVTGWGSKKTTAAKPAGDDY